MSNLVLDTRIAHRVLRILIGDNCQTCISRPAGVLDANQESLEVGRVHARVALRFIFSFQPTALGSGYAYAQQLYDRPSVVSDADRLGGGS